MTSHMISWQARMIWIDSDAELTVFSNAIFRIHAIIVLLCFDDISFSVVNRYLAEFLMMGKELSEMTLEEMWDLFPIFLVQHDDRWNEYFKEIEDTIIDLLTDFPDKRVSDIGSTAIQGIWAKSIVDVMVEISEKANMDEVAHILDKNGFVKMSDEDGRIVLNKGYSKDGFADKVYHMHLRYIGDDDELYFRDYLNEHPQTEKEYEALNLELWKKYEHDRDAYTDAKTDFIRKWTMESRREYVDRY